MDKDRKIYEDVFDNLTIRSIERHIAKGDLLDIQGNIKSGKEAQVFSARDRSKRPVVLKVYLVETSSFQNMSEYITGDRRFHNVGKNKRKIVYLWCAKEYRNLKKAHSCGISVPEPLAYSNNTLLMELVSRDGSSDPAPQLVDFYMEDPKKMFSMILEEMKGLYSKAGLVHADLSEFNILVRDGRPVLIDMGQSVILKHPMASKFLKRDIRNILAFFSKHGIKKDPEEILSQFSE